MDKKFRITVEQLFLLFTASVNRLALFRRNDNPDKFINTGSQACIVY